MSGATLVIVGGGGFRVPLVYRALSSAPFAGLVSDVVLVDTLPDRAHAIARVLGALPSGARPAPSVRVEARLEDALPGADLVFAAVRSGGAEGRILDERVALACGLLGQETVGAGGIAYALRSIPDMMRVATLMRDLAPDAWLINFTNPAGMVTEALSAVLGSRVIGICDSASGLVTRAARAAGVDLRGSLTGVDYVGLNHLGWLRRLDVDGHDRLPGLLTDAPRLAGFEEGRLFGPDLLRVLGALPNEYLFYYYFHREALRSIRAADRTRGETLRDQQADLFPRLLASADPFGVWEAARRERESGYLAEARPADEERDEADLAGGGYERVALQVMRSLLTGRRAELILNVRNGTTFAELPADAVVEVPSVVDADGARPLPAAPPTPHQLGLMAAVKAVEQDTVRAAVHRDRDAALRAFAGHPLVDSFHAATRVLAGYEEAFPALRASWSD
ncbi:6-phospho-beta-glucosidase [Arthrobacter pityocampae]|uniref:6-phospho-beta-glucosidase n=1 Tax=Arthrobacter pityocampae TaxID=547334 RepID=A0A2S5J2H5_9MICC|nr:6-phospho-beta-glucosidase [Arthrobacter pityocampae]PPB50995.1 6-phospho-beta-glucosidase [Arthrobacter pityocampae]